MDIQILFDGKIIRTQRVESRLLDEPRGLIEAKKGALVAAIDDRELSIAQALRAEIRVVELTSKSNA